MRARLALQVSAIEIEHREVLLRDKPDAMLAASPKGTVPVLVTGDGGVLEESLDIMRWALGRHDPEGWLSPGEAMTALIAACDGDFKHHLDRYKYATRYEDTDPVVHREANRAYLETLETRLTQGGGQLFGERMSLADAAIFPFIRQFANTDRAWFDALDLPALQAWLADHLASARFRAIMAKHTVWSPQ